MTEGVIRISGNVLSASTVVAIEKGMITRGGMALAARRAAISLVKPKWYKAIPYVGWAITIGGTLYAGYEAYNATVINYNKMENEIYSEEDMKAFRMGYTESNSVFIQTRAGIDAERNKQKYILIPAEVMPMIAAVDTIGIGQFGNVLSWDPANKASRRYAALKGRGPAGKIAYTDGTTVAGSWEEYPFASTLCKNPGVHVDKAPLRENWIQGGFIRAASMVQEFNTNDTIHSYILG